MSESVGIWLGVSGLTGVIFIFVGIWSRHWAPEHINHMFGYRTRASMRSQASWDFAQAYSGKRFQETGIVLIILSLLRIMLPLWSGELEVLMSLGLVIVSIFYPLLRTEYALGKFFDADGNKRA